LFFTIFINNFFNEDDEGGDLCVQANNHTMIFMTKGIVWCLTPNSSYLGKIYSRIAIIVIFVKKKIESISFLHIQRSSFTVAICDFGYVPFFSEGKISKITSGSVEGRSLTHFLYFLDQCYFFQIIFLVLRTCKLCLWTWKIYFLYFSWYKWWYLPA